MEIELKFIRSSRTTNRFKKMEPEEAIRVIRTGNPGWADGRSDAQIISDLVEGAVVYTEFFIIEADLCITAEVEIVRSCVSK